MSRKVILRDSKGRTMALPGKTTIKQLVERGMTPRLVNERAPLPDGWWRADKPETGKEVPK